MIHPLAQTFTLAAVAGGYTMKGIDIQSAHLESISATTAGTVNNKTVLNLLPNIALWYPSIGSSLTSQSLSLITPSSNPITWTGSPTAGSGYTSFNGTSQYGTASAVGLPTGNSRTISLWIYVTNAIGTGTEQPFFQYGTPGTISEFIGMEMYTGKVFMSQWGSSLFSFNTIPLNTWTHLVLTISSGQWQLYVNGVVDNSTGMTTNTVIAGSGPNSLLWLAAYNNTESTTLKFAGSLSNIMILNIVLTPTQVTDLYNWQYQIQHQKGLF